MTKKMQKLLAQTMAAVTLFAACQQGFAMQSFADGGLTLTSKKEENVTVSVNGSTVTLTDTDANNDVWNSKVLFEADKALVPGKEYQISFELNGDNGVGELFLCKSSNLDDRYDDTFTSEAGSRSYTFTAAGPKLYIGMQMGNIGVGNTVSAVINDVCEREQAKYPELLTTANCDVEIVDGKLIATDTSDNDDVWNSKVLLEVDADLVIGKKYEIDFSLAGDNGVGEFFVCKSPDLNDRYDGTFANGKGKQSVHFKAETPKLYIGMQFGSIGKGNSVSMKLDGVKKYLVPVAPPTVDYTVTDKDGILTIVATDLSSNNDVWNSQVLVPLYGLKKGVEYEITFNVSGEHGVGEVFLNTDASLDFDKHYTRSDTPNNEDWQVFVNQEDNLTMRFVAQGSVAYIGMQMGNIGEGNSVTVKITKPTAYLPGVKHTEACSYEVTTDEDSIVKIVAVDENAEEEGVWTSKLVYFLGNLLETGKNYVVRVAATGVGEVFLKKDDSIGDVTGNAYAEMKHNDPWTSVNDLAFTATSDQLYAGLQFGAPGTGNRFEVEIQDVIEVPFALVGQTDRFNVVSAGNDSIAISNKWKEENQPFTTQALYDTGIALKAGEVYTLHFSLDGAGEGKAEFFIPGNLDDPYNWQTRLPSVGGGDCFSNSSADGQTFTFVATEDTNLFFAIQIGGLASDELFKLSDVSVERAKTVPAAASLEAEEEEVEELEEVAEVEEEEVVETETTVEETEEVETTEEETVEAETPVEETEEVETTEEETEETEAPEEETEAPEEEVVEEETVEEAPAEETPVEEVSVEE